MSVLNPAAPEFCIMRIAGHRSTGLPHVDDRSKLGHPDMPQYGDPSNNEAGLLSESSSSPSVRHHSSTASDVDICSPGSSIDADMDENGLSKRLNGSRPLSRTWSAPQALLSLWSGALSPLPQPYDHQRYPPPSAYSTPAAEAPQTPQLSIPYSPTLTAADAPLAYLAMPKQADHLLDLNSKQKLTAHITNTLLTLYTTHRHAEVLEIAALPSKYAQNHLLRPGIVPRYARLSIMYGSHVTLPPLPGEDMQGDSVQSEGVHQAETYNWVSALTACPSEHAAFLGCQDVQLGDYATITRDEDVLLEFELVVEGVGLGWRVVVWRAATSSTITSGDMDQGFEDANETQMKKIWVEPKDDDCDTVLGEVVEDVRIMGDSWACDNPSGLPIVPDLRSGAQDTQTENGTRTPSPPHGDS